MKTKPSMYYINAYSRCRSPYGRLTTDGRKCSGEYFRDEVLIPAIHKCKSNFMVIDMDSYSIPMGASWIDEVFHNLAPKYKIFLSNHLVIKSTKMIFITYAVQRFLGLPLRKQHDFYDIISTCPRTGCISTRPSIFNFYRLVTSLPDAKKIKKKR